MSEIGPAFDLVSDLGLGLGLTLMVSVFERRLGRASWTSSSGSLVEIGCLDFATRLNRCVLFISLLWKESRAVSNGKEDKSNEAFELGSLTCWDFGGY